MPEVTKKKSLKQLQNENDAALLKFWEAVEMVSACKRSLHATREYLALRLAEDERDRAERPMAAARMAFLKARLRGSR